ncbi:glycosyltransferase family 4 protein [Brevundimonas sp. R86498]|uniref:glycosyltransferase family 4 protein n=1 Tax=Brevundimonas sp. R86498 TaxID=3093845 RepID=UPI0037CB8D2B
MNAPNFALYNAGDAYSTAAKIMGRQSAGKAMIKGIARRWPTGEVNAFSAARSSAESLASQLRSEGHTGVVRWIPAPGNAGLDALGALYHPAPVTIDLAHGRNTRGSAAYSLFGVTHTLSSTRAMDEISAMVTAPFQPWDALVCTSSAAHAVVRRLQEARCAWLAEHLGVTKFSAVALPVIPLGIDAPAFASSESDRAEARQSLGLGQDDVAFLFAGRLTYHAKANPAVLYQALEAAAARTDRALVCVEAGVFASTAVRDAFQNAQRVLAPSVRFIAVDGAEAVAYRQAWRAADAFVSLSDNIQETFGLTPLEAMAAGLPVLVSDWNGYKDTVRDGIDGYRIPVTLPPVGSGADLALRHATAQDSYDYFIGRTSMMTVVDPATLTERIVALAEAPALRARLGQAGQMRALKEFDWPVILDRYTALADDLGEIRRSVGATPRQAWPARPDPCDLFGTYPTHILSGRWTVTRSVDTVALDALLDLPFARFAIDPVTLPRETIVELHAQVESGQTVKALLETHPAATPVKVRALMWLCKFGVLRLNR